MTDLILQLPDNLTSEGLVQALANEKKEMLGEHRVSAKGTGFHRLAPAHLQVQLPRSEKQGGEKEATPSGGR
jgi:hypothetical protein